MGWVIQTWDWELCQNFLFIMKHKVIEEQNQKLYEFTMWIAHLLGKQKVSNSILSIGCTLNLVLSVAWGRNRVSFTMRLSLTLCKLRPVCCDDGKAKTQFPKKSTAILIEKKKMNWTIFRKKALLKCCHQFNLVRVNILCALRSLQMTHFDFIIYLIEWKKNDLDIM